MCGVCLNLINKEINKKCWDSAGFEPPLPPSKQGQILCKRRSYPLRHSALMLMK